MFYVYVLKSLKNGDIYIGKSGDLRKRYKQHNEGQVKATSPNMPWRLIYYEAYFDKKDISKREVQLKNHRAKHDLKLQLKFSLNLS